MQGLTDHECAALAEVGAWHAPVVVALVEVGAVLARGKAVREKGPNPRGSCQTPVEEESDLLGSFAFGRQYSEGCLGEAWRQGGRGLEHAHEEDVQGRRVCMLLRAKVVPRSCQGRAAWIRQTQCSCCL